MSNEITITIDGKPCATQEGEFLLNVARANDIFVPAICYLSKCTPTLACRLCLVEADGKQVYACNAKAKDGMNITTSTQNIETERKAIMEVYDVNHPLQCGVCDQSGECELQNYTLYMGVDAQNQAVRDVNRPTTNWGVMNYDPGLCIVCEKCVTVCKDMIGSNALSTVKRGADPLDKDYKANMPKDAYAMWNKLNKSLIGFEEDKCTDCGECIAVCPVGALVSTDFQYTSNAWELTKIPASNPHSSDCALMYYEVKHESVENNQDKKIYRVTNESHYASLCGAARFGYDFENKVEAKDETAFENTIAAFKKADTIKFTSYISNEEALILQKLKQEHGYKLVNSDASAFKSFMDNYSATAGTNFYSGDLDDIHNSNFVVSVGSMLKTDAHSVRYAFNNAISMNKGAGLYFHPVADPIVEGFGKKGKTIETIAHNVGAEEAILYFVLDQFGNDLPKDVEEYLNSMRQTRTKTVTETIKETIVEMVKDEETGEEKEVKKIVPKKVSTEVEYTYTQLLDMIGSDEELLVTIEAMLAKKDTYSIIVGEDCISSTNSANIAKLAGLISRYTQFKVVIIPTQTNTLGVSLICDLDDAAGSYSIGYNHSGDYVLHALGTGDLDMPALNQQEGTFTNINKRLVPTNAALPYNGYELNDIANELGLRTRLTVDYTACLPLEKGYAAIAFDDLDNHYANDFSEHRGYLLSTSQGTNDDTVEKITQNNSFDAQSTIIYRANPINQFNEFTQKAHELNEKTAYYVSVDMAAKLEVTADDKVQIEANDQTFTLDVVIDNQIAGEIGYVSTFDNTIATRKLFDGYRYQQAKIKKV
ncbi:MAG: NADH-quinone oxidoreductase subunit G [Campylobacterota bacterium]|nr:NADH-quinone oxidoreductase subunit G [Campylobacterota bacterium]